MADVSTQTEDRLKVALADDTSAQDVIDKLNLNGAATAGTVEASKAVIADASKNVGTFGDVDAGSFSLDGNLEIQTAQVTVTSAQLLALNATPQTLVAAPGANKAIVVDKIVLYHGGGTAYAGVAAGEDLAFKYTDASGAEACPQVETTGFLDQTGAECRIVRYGAPTGATGDIDVTGGTVANAPLVVHLLSGEITTGDFDLLIKVWYSVVDTVLS